MAALLMKIVMTINRAQQAYQAAMLSESAFWAVHDIIVEAEAEREASAGTLRAPFERACVFDNVSFAYDNRPILRNVSFAIKAGEITTVTGASGAGKTTVVDLCTACTARRAARSASTTLRWKTWISCIGAR